MVESSREVIDNMDALERGLNLVTFCDLSLHNVDVRAEQLVRFISITNQYAYCLMFFK
jgi:hypothetical protein